MIKHEWIDSTYQPRQRRSGAVLILVIVLLVLMALMGIAYLASVRSDRAASSQNIINTQIELLVDGVRSMANIDIEQDIAPTSLSFRPSASPEHSYQHSDSIVDRQQDSYLAARAPLSLAELAINDADAGAAQPGAGWVVRSGSDLMVKVQSAGGGFNLSAPLVAPDGSRLGADVIAWPALSQVGARPFGELIASAGGGQSVRMYSDGGLRIGSRGSGNVNDLDGRRPAFPIEVIAGGAIMPGLRLYDNSGRPIDLVAGDADGDGIADALLFDLNFEQNGVKYVAGVRVIDNNSALNLTTAGQSEHDITPQRQVWDLFPGNIDLLRLIQPGDSLAALRSRIIGGNVNALPSQLIAETRAPIAGFSYRSLADLFWMHVGRRVDHPGYIFAPIAGVGSLPAGDTAALARRFVVGNNPALALADSILPHTLGINVLNLSRLMPYQPSEVKGWFDDHFNPRTAISARGLVVSRNPVSNATVTKSYWDIDQPAKEYPNLQPADDPPSDGDPGNDHLQVMPPYEPISVKADVNTADFATLWQGYWSVMASDAKQSYPSAQVYNPAAMGSPDGAGRMFRDVDRVDRSRYAEDPDLTPDQLALATVGVNVPGMVLLRSALAAVNTIDMRDVDDEATVVEFEQKASAQGGNRRFRIYGYEAQPFLTECVIYKNFATTDQIQPDGSTVHRVDYQKHVVAIELFNPYERDLNIGSYALALIDRQNQWPRTLQGLMDENQWDTAVRAALGIGSTSPVMLPARQRLVLYNNEDERGGHLTEADDLLNSLPAGALRVRVPGLGQAVGQELVILKPRRPGQLQADELLTGAQGLANRVPVDQIDLTGFIYPSNIFEVGPNGELIEHFRKWYHYARANDTGGTGWTWVFPGRYSVYPSDKINPRSGEAGIKLRYQGFDEDGSDNLPAHQLGAADTGTTNLKFCIPLGLPNSPGPATSDGSPVTSPLPADVTLAYPFGGFARNGDILQVPYIGAYRVQYMGGPNPLDASQPNLPPNTPGEFAELNSISMDSAFADDLNSNNDAQEQVGRFVPLIDPAGDDPHYRWAAVLLDYLTVQAPYDDYMPNISKEAYWSLLERAGWKPTGMTPAQENIWRNNNQPTPIANFYISQASANQPVEKLIGVEGLINLNTASWPVIATLPLLPPSLQGADNNGNGVPDGIEALARSIVYDRQIHGPYQSLFELNRIPAYTHAPLRAGDASLIAPAFADAMGSWQSTNFTQEHGDLSTDPATGSPATDHLIGTFEDRYLMMNRISNQVTLRSDSFTVYLVVQGWRDAGTPQASLVAQRRDAYIVDRTHMTRLDRTMIIRNVPQD
ncbi:MAG: hypothetical protein IT448_02125 [Phycisphaerales bacterium]|nr:hypothetical protein [Phycisphaerales bacterium]